MEAALIVGFTVSALALLGFWSIRRTDTQLAALEQIAQAMNFSVSPQLRRARGVLYAQPESLGVETRVTALQTERGGDDGFRITCQLLPPLHMGLELTSRTLRSPWTAYWDPRYGEPGLHDMFKVKALHEDQIEELLDGWILRELVTARSNGFAPRVNDYSVSLRMKDTHNPWVLAAAIERAARLADALVRARARMRPSRLERSVESGFVEVARLVSGVFDRESLGLHVESEAGKLSVFVEHVRGSDWQTVFQLELHRQFAPGLQLADSRASSLYDRWIGPDIPVGDPAFDAAFVVRGKHEETVRSILTHELRQALLTLREKLDSVTVEGGRVSGRVSGVLSETRELERAVLALLAVGEAFVTTRRGGRSAYR